MGWRKLDGPGLTVSVKAGGINLKANDVVQITAGAAVPATVGCLVAGVMYDDALTGEDNKKMSLLVPGTIWQADVASQTLARGTRVVMGAASTVTGGAPGNVVVGMVVNRDILPGDTTAEILILGGHIVI